MTLIRMNGAPGGPHSSGHSGVGAGRSGALTGFSHGSAGGSEGLPVGFIMEPPGSLQQDLSVPLAVHPTAVAAMQQHLRPQSHAAPYRDFSRVQLEDETDKEGEQASGSKSVKEPTFPVKLHEILSNPKYQQYITWLPHGRSWRVLKPKGFEEHVIPAHYRHSKYASFMRQVNGWGFKRVTSGPDHNSYYHEMFLRGMPQLCLRMRRSSRTKSQLMESHLTPDFYKISVLAPLPEEVQTASRRNSASGGKNASLMAPSSISGKSSRKEMDEKANSWNSLSASGGALERNLLEPSSMSPGPFLSSMISKADEVGSTIASATKQHQILENSQDIDQHRLAVLQGQASNIFRSKKDSRDGDVGTVSSPHLAPDSLGVLDQVAVGLSSSMAMPFLASDPAGIANQAAAVAQMHFGQQQLSYQNQQHLLQFQNNQALQYQALLAQLASGSKKNEDSVQGITKTFM